MKRFAISAFAVAAIAALTPFPAAAQSDAYIKCVAEKSDPDVGAMLVDQFLSEQGLADAPEPFVSDFRQGLVSCSRDHAASQEEATQFAKVAIVRLMMPPLRVRLDDEGIDLDAVDGVLALETNDGSGPSVEENDLIFATMIAQLVDERGANRDLLSYLMASYTESARIDREARASVGGTK